MIIALTLALWSKVDTSQIPAVNLLKACLFLVSIVYAISLDIKLITL